MPPLKPHQLLDAMPETKRYMKRRLRNAPVDFESFMTPLKVCELSECQGMCCHDGVCIDEDEEHYVTAIMEAHPVYFRDEVNLTPEKAFEDATFLDAECRKTRTRKFKYPEGVMPKHFTQTSCVFRFPDGRCSLQSLAMEHGEHPWAYKPLSCWLHPISLERDDRTILWIPTFETDHLKEEGYPGYSPYTGCGAACEGGKPAYQALKWELETLGEVVGRDFWSEMDAYYEQNVKKNGKKPAAVS